MERFVGDNFEIAFDGANGRIRRALIDRHSVLYGTPKLHVLPIEATLNEFPIFETCGSPNRWRFAPQPTTMK